MTQRTFVAVGSSHLWGVLLGCLDEASSGAHLRTYQRNEVASAELDLDAGWRGRFVFFNSGVTGMPPHVREGVLYVPQALTGVVERVDAGAEVVFSLMRGQEFGVVSLVDDPSHPDFNDDDSRCEAGRQWVSIDDAAEWVRQVAEPILASNLVLRQRFPNARIVHVPAPPPIESEDHILGNVESFGALFAQYGVKPYAARRRLYKLMYAGLQRELAAYGIESLPLPGASLTASGGLRSDHAVGCMHGNGHYGRGVAELMKARLARAG